MKKLFEKTWDLPKKSDVKEVASSSTTKERVKDRFVLGNFKCY